MVLATEVVLEILSFLPKSLRGGAEATRLFEVVTSCWGEYWGLGPASRYSCPHRVQAVHGSGKSIRLVN